MAKLPRMTHKSKDEHIETLWERDRERIATIVNQGHEIAALQKDISMCCDHVKDLRRLNAQRVDLIIKMDAEIDALKEKLKLEELRVKTLADQVDNILHTRVAQRKSASLTRKKS